MRLRPARHLGSRVQPSSERDWTIGSEHADSVTTAHAYISRQSNSRAEQQGRTAGSVALTQSLVLCCSPAAICTHHIATRVRAARLSTTLTRQESRALAKPRRRQRKCRRSSSVLEYRSPKFEVPDCAFSPPNITECTDRRRVVGTSAKRATSASSLRVVDVKPLGWANLSHVRVRSTVSSPQTAKARTVYRPPCGSCAAGMREGERTRGSLSATLRE